MNNVQLIGRLTADPELRHTQSGTACTRFNVAVDRRVKQGEEKQTDFITVVAWQQRAEFICKYFTKGQRIALTGRIQTGSYIDSEGKKRSTFDVMAENVEFCDSKNSQKTDTKSIEVENTADFEQVPDDKDLPF
ncbi:MAG: single-stranded DNA-binding protein [Clostridia bacterium]|nr:single-stranded DNA-binding protein [Clostridia bacterium]